MHCMGQDIVRINWYAHVEIRPIEAVDEPSPHPMFCNLQ